MERNERDLDRELIELLNELRVALPGVQMLFGFLLAVPFSNGFGQTSDLERGVYFVAFLAAAAASVLLIAPTGFHRLLWRRREKEHLLRMANTMAIAGLGFLAVAISAAVFVVSSRLYGSGSAAAVAAVTAAAVVWCWYGQPLARRARRTGFAGTDDGVT